MGPDEIPPLVRRPQLVGEMPEIGKTLATARRIEPSDEVETLVNGWIVENVGQLSAWIDIASMPTLLRYNGNSDHTHLNLWMDVEVDVSR